MLRPRSTGRHQYLDSVCVYWKHLTMFDCVSSRRAFPLFNLMENSQGNEAIGSHLRDIPSLCFAWSFMFMRWSITAESTW